MSAKFSLLNDRNAKGGSRPSPTEKTDSSLAQDDIASIHAKRGCLTKSEAALKNTMPGSVQKAVQEPGFGVKLRCETKLNASRLYSIRDWISSVLATEYRKNDPVRRSGKITQRCFGGVGL